MKYFFFLSLVLLSLYTTGQESQTSEEPDPMGLFNKDFIGKDFPEFSFSTIDSVHISSSSLKGKIVFINFWFEACPPCVAEFGALSELYQKLKDSTNFEFISFTFESAETIKKVRMKYDMPYRIVSISRKDISALLLKRSGYPTNVILDKNGKVAYWGTGGSTDAGQARDYIMTKVYSKILNKLGKGYVQL